MMRPDDPSLGHSDKQQVEDRPRVIRRDAAGQTPVVEPDLPVVERDPAVVERRTEAVVERPITTRGGIAPGAIVTGMFVALGSFAILTALAGGILLRAGYATTTQGSVLRVGVLASLAILLAEALASLWGGYTAGRMGRGLGMLNGMLVPITAAIIGGITTLVVRALGSTADLALPFTRVRFDVDPAVTARFGVALGAASILVMLLASALGGMLGEGWHSKLESRAPTNATTTRVA